jgi:very-short-patch-repair endonuclease
MKLNLKKISFLLDFDRQIVIDNYIIDFYIKSLGLAVGNYGWYHEFKKGKR